MTAESASASCCQIMKVETEFNFKVLKKPFISTLSVFILVSMLVGPFLLELRSVYVADGINNPYNIQSDGVEIQSFWWR